VGVFLHFLGCLVGEGHWDPVSIGRTVHRRRQTHRLNRGENHLSQVSMATSKTPGPLQHDAHSINSRGTLGCDAGCPRGHTPGPIRVAEAPADSHKKPAQPAPAKIDKIIWHLYADLIRPTPGTRNSANRTSRTGSMRSMTPVTRRAPANGTRRGSSSSLRPTPKRESKTLNAHCKPKGRSWSTSGIRR